MDRLVLTTTSRAGEMMMEAKGRSAHVSAQGPLSSLLLGGLP